MAERAGLAPALPPAPGSARQLAASVGARESGVQAPGQGAQLSPDGGGLITGVWFRGC